VREANIKIPLFPARNSPRARHAHYILEKVDSSKAPTMAVKSENGDFHGMRLWLLKRKFFLERWFCSSS